MTTTITINGEVVTTGCWVDGHWGQYAPDHFADKIDGLIDIDPLNDPRVLRRIADDTEAAGYPDAAAMWWEAHTEATDKLMERLNELTPGCWTFQWWEGEIHLSRYCEWPDTDLDDLPDCCDGSNCPKEGNP